MKRRQQRPGWLLGLAGGVFLLSAGLFFVSPWPPAQAQLPVNLFAAGFSTTEYYTNRNQVRMRITGKSAQPAGPDRYVIRQVRLETFHEDGEPELAIEAPECIYDLRLRAASSAGSLKIVFGEGRMSFSGEEGFHWQQTPTSLIISNQATMRVRELPYKRTNP